MPTDAPLYRDPTRPFDERARDLVARLTTAEKIAMLHQRGPAVERLGLRAFTTGAEVLHGVSWLGTATVYPQPVGLGATWDPELLERIGDAVGVELRAKHAADPSVSLNVWAPVVNPLRHPAWGRNEEGFSEDPHVTAELATAYARGLRGRHPVYWRTVPALKHAFGYNNETDRAVTSSQLRPRVLHEYELPAFLGPLRAATAGAVMAAYNLVDGRPNHLQGELLDLLRDAADGSLLIVSDAAAPGFVVTLQRYYDDHVEAHAAMLRAGIDSFTDNDADSAPTIERVTAALERGLLDEAVIDRAVARQLELRLRTAELDPELDPFVVGPDAIDLPEHRALAREAVARSVVVLENDGVLPLRPGVRVAVVGPHADRALHDWYSGTPPYLVGLGTALTERLGADAVRVVDGADRLVLRSVRTGGAVRASGSTHVLTADGDASDASAQHDLTHWGDGLWSLQVAGSGLLWSGARWVVHADATRLGGWVAQEAFRRQVHADGTWSLQHAGSGKWLRVQHDEAGTLVADGETPEQADRFTAEVLVSGAQAVRDACADADVVVVAVGNDPHLGGRETADRPSLELPGSMLALWRAARDGGADGPRRVLLVVSSYPYVLPPDLDADAVVWTSHGGQELGHGLTDVLTGDEEPRGRLTQAWPRASADVGDLFDYDVIAGGHTTWYAAHAPRYALGHGLTYGDVRYVGARLVDPAPVDPDVADHTAVRVALRNDGPRDAHELVQVYADAPAHRLPFGHRLVAHVRVLVPAGGEAEVDVPVRLERLATWDVTRDLLVVEPGPYELRVGASATDLPHALTLEVAGAPVPPRTVVGRAVRAADGDAFTDVELSAWHRTEGTAVQVARRRTSGTVELWTCDVRRARGLRGVLARTGPGVAQVRLAVRVGTGWRTLATLDAAAGGGRWDWSERSAPLQDLPAGDVHDLRLELVGAVRVGAVELTS
ncbi:glycoside hydrolase family 3 C-terminal domain-containing protein [Cellulomonas gilvus]|uniref:Glycoside hydrolase family 3 domain protein n=1 Tax=Cellulomonas gilvus (strain ATCC 13127 / NRRL B-14078) TaxID=593907 RepID=F8A210_CELGA|nr:glycoside hydrolase family 3 C-terminal domain-containing protein [Cellulomonas gilvus]AEI12954.1 glycoside hydrolase family 3 domain protein [Cellulomonas gilvus ATCC 13127]